MGASWEENIGGFEGLVRGTVYLTSATLNFHISSNPSIRADFREGDLDGPIRGAQFTADRIAPISNRTIRIATPHSVRFAVLSFSNHLIVEVFSNRAIRFARFGSLADPDSNRVH